MSQETDAKYSRWYPDWIKTPTEISVSTAPAGDTLSPGTFLLRPDAEIWFTMGPDSSHSSATSGQYLGHRIPANGTLVAHVDGSYPYVSAVTSAGTGTLQIARLASR